MVTTIVQPLRRAGSGRAGVPAAPRGLSSRSRRLWVELHAEFELSATASRLLEEMLFALDLAASCRATIAAEGIAVPGRYAGVPRAHHLLPVARDATRTAERIAARLGLNLAEDVAHSDARTRIAVPGRVRQLGLLAGGLDEEEG